MSRGELEGKSRKRKEGEGKKTVILVDRGEMGKVYWPGHGGKQGQKRGILFPGVT